MKEHDLNDKQVARFEAKVDKSAGLYGCWLWTASLNAMGYGQVKVNWVLMLTHRLSLFMADGPPPEGKPLALHSCRNTNCVNPAHLRWGNSEQNNGVDKERDGTSNAGARNGMAKLTEAEVLFIHAEALSGRDYGELAEEFDIPECSVSAIKTGRQWSSVTGQNQDEADQRGGNNRKLTEEQVLDIYERANAGEHQGDIAAEYDVSRGTVSEIKHGKRWTHVTGHNEAA